MLTFTLYRRHVLFCSNLEPIFSFCFPYSGHHQKKRKKEKSFIKLKIVHTESKLRNKGTLRKFLDNNVQWTTYCFWITVTQDFSFKDIFRTDIIAIPIYPTRHFQAPIPRQCPWWFLGVMFSNSRIMPWNCQKQKYFGPRKDTRQFCNSLRLGNVAVAILHSVYNPAVFLSIFPPPPILSLT